MHVLQDAYNVQVVISGDLSVDPLTEGVIVVVVCLI